MNKVSQCDTAYYKPNLRSISSDGVAFAAQSFDFARISLNREASWISRITDMSAVLAFSIPLALRERCMYDMNRCLVGRFFFSCECGFMCEVCMCELSCCCCCCCCRCCYLFVYVVCLLVCLIFYKHMHFFLLRVRVRNEHMSPSHVPQTPTLFFLSASHKENESIERRR